MKKREVRRDRQQPEEVTAGLTTKSAKIRALDRAGYSRFEIARCLGLRDQHVRNVLAQPRPDRAKVRLGPGGRIVIPAPFREALDIKEGDELILRLAAGGLRVESLAAGVRRARERVARYLKEGDSLVARLIAERRQEAEREDRHG